MKEKINEQGFADAAKALDCEPAAIKAVCDVEAPKGGFLDDDRVRILFERHKFYKYTGGRLSPYKEHSDICNPQPGGYGQEGAHQWARFSKAFALDPRAAMLSCSWGKFQIMGFNFTAAGFGSLDAFVEAMKLSENEQLKAFVKLVKSFGLAGKLKRHDWAGFALGYNGENYRINRYDQKLAVAYRKHARDAGVQSVGSSVADMVEPVEISEPGAEAALEPGTLAADPARTSSDDGTQTASPASGMVASPDAKEVKIATMSPTTKVISFGALATAALGFLQQAWQSSQEHVISGAQFALAHLPMVLLILGVAAIGLYIYNQAAKRAAARTAQIVEIAANKDKHDVVIT